VDSSDTEEGILLIAVMAMRKTGCGSRWLGLGTTAPSVATEVVSFFFSTRRKQEMTNPSKVRFHVLNGDEYEDGCLLGCSTVLPGRF
jgi:hypothetical protein